MRYFKIRDGPNQFFAVIVVIQLQMTSVEKKSASLCFIPFWLSIAY